MGIDPGEKNIGIALSDPSGTIANPLTVLPHIQRKLDAAAIIKLAEFHQVELIVIGQALDADNQPTLQGRRSARLAGAVRAKSNFLVVLWDESDSTLEARKARQAMEVRRNQRRGHMDELAATVILQSYLDAHPDRPIEKK